MYTYEEDTTPLHMYTYEEDTTPLHMYTYEEDMTPLHMYTCAMMAVNCSAVCTFNTVCPVTLLPSVWGISTPTVVRLYSGSHTPSSEVDCAFYNIYVTLCVPYYYVHSAVSCVDCVLYNTCDAVCTILFYVTQCSVNSNDPCQHSAASCKLIPAD
eukprot:TRINITY_DN58866_c0_g1_i1.p1 TRINITY_DN58866_c0_g1~~TRINITY_DN58866_c0_g1_i1.p1  ORF type:complete len:155 (-),score=19.06 TRINITY_DN58866_c0_g1_i1:4-468(-)